MCMQIMKEQLKYIKKLGFKEFGRLKRGIKREDKYIDNIQMYKEL